jgi:MFS family permease
MVGLGLIGFLTSGLLGPIWAIMQSVTKIRMRSTAAALFQLMTNLIGMGVGPALIGYLNDRFAPRYGDISIRYSMLVLAAAHSSRICAACGVAFVSRDAARTAGPIESAARATQGAARAASAGDYPAALSSSLALPPSSTSPTAPPTSMKLRRSRLSPRLRRWAWAAKPVPAGIRRPTMTFSFNPLRSSFRPRTAASVSTRVVSWKEAAEW